MENKNNENNELLLHQINSDNSCVFTPQEVSIIFNSCSNIQVGKFYIEDNKLKFEGDADTSAELFINLVLNKFNTRNEK